MFYFYSLLIDKKRHSKYLVLRPGAQRTNQLLIRSPRCLLMSCLVRTDYYYLLCNSISSCTWKLFEPNGKFWVKVLIIQALKRAQSQVFPYKEWFCAKWCVRYGLWSLRDEPVSHLTDFTARQQPVTIAGRF